MSLTQLHLAFQVADKFTSTLSAPCLSLLYVFMFWVFLLWKEIEIIVFENVNGLYIILMLTAKIKQEHCLSSYTWHHYICVFAKKHLQAVLGTIVIFNSLSLRYYFNEVQVSSFLDLPTQKPLILKSVKYFTLDPDIKLSFFYREMKTSCTKTQKERGKGNFCF